MSYFDLKNDVVEAEKIFKEKQEKFDNYIKNIPITVNEIIEEMDRMVKCTNFSECPLDKLGITLVENILAKRERERAERKSMERDY